MMKEIQSQSGVILVTTLWILLILSVIALGFSVELHLEARMARYQLDSHTAYYLAKAGIERAMVELKNDAILDHKSRPAIYDALMDSWSNNEDTDGIFQEVELGEGFYTVKIVDEYSKLNINRAGYKQFLGLFKALEFDEDDAKYLAGAIIDYRDRNLTYQDDTSMTEEEFYFGSDAYDTTTTITHFRNGDFVSVEELLQVPGITPEILYQPHKVYDEFDQEIKLIDILTIYGDGIVNMNTATLPVLTGVIVGIGEGDLNTAIEVARNIIDHRDGSDDEDATTDDQPYTNSLELTGDMGPLNPALAAMFQMSMRPSSDLFRITSIGEISRAKKKVEALVRREWVLTPYTEEEQKELENANKGGFKEGVRLYIIRWMEF